MGGRPSPAMTRGRVPRCPYVSIFAGSYELAGAAMPVAWMGKAAICLGRCGLLIRRPQVRPDHQTSRHARRIWHCANINGTVGSHAIVIVRVGAMPFQNHYVITENIERFEGLLREGELDCVQNSDRRIPPRPGPRGIGRV